MYVISFRNKYFISRPDRDEWPLSYHINDAIQFKKLSTASLCVRKYRSKISVLYRSRQYDPYLPRTHGSKIKHFQIVKLDDIINQININSVMNS